MLLFTLWGCANITHPTGGLKDKIPPKLVEIEPKDSLLNTRVTKIVMNFDEYITVSDASTEVEISPILPIPPSVIGLNKHVTVKLIDSLLDSNTTYRIRFGKAIKDLHEGNPFRKYTYIFSTGSYFDTLQLAGHVIDAKTGKTDTTGTVELYVANAKDSDVIRKKPRYSVKIDNKGNFLFRGLPDKKFRIYALKESTSNLIYDGIGEKIAFNDSVVAPHTPKDSTFETILLRLFEEKIDTGSNIQPQDSTSKITKSDSLKKKTVSDTSKQKGFGRVKPQKSQDTTLSYTVQVDTSNVTKRSFDIANNNPVKLIFTRAPMIKKEKINLYIDSSGIEYPVQTFIETDTVTREVYKIRTKWRENKLYKLKLAKGFASDSAGKELLPSKYVFRTMEEDDYGTLKIHIPAKYNDTMYLLRVELEKDSVYQKRISDTMAVIKYLKPGKYSFSIIADKNGNGQWDTGDLLDKVQPEWVFPHFEAVTLKAGWEVVVDFSEKQNIKPKDGK